MDRRATLVGLYTKSRALPVPLPQLGDLSVKAPLRAFSSIPLTGSPSTKSFVIRYLSHSYAYAALGEIRNLCSLMMRGSYLFQCPSSRRRLAS